MRSIQATVFGLAILLTSGAFAQTELQASSKLIVDDGYDHAELSVTEWGGSHGLFFGSKINYTGSDHLWSAGNAKYARAAGSFNYGAFSMGYIANGGQFSFFDGGLSTGLNNPISWNAVMTIIRGGNIGMGTTEPTEKLELSGSNFINAENKGLIVDAGGWKRVGFMKYAGREAGIWRVAGQKFEIGRTDLSSLANTPGAFTTDLFVGGEGNVGIGTTEPGQYKLAVEGKIGARKVVVTQTPWADYVFEKDYHLPTLAEVEKYIQQYKHLPDVPSAAEVEENGLDLGGNQAVLLKKIEELTLYIIEQNKKIEQLEIKQKEIEKIKKIMDLK